MSGDKDFKVVDRRGQQDSPKTEQTAAGEGFVMKDSPSSPEGIDFTTFVFSLATGAIIHLGLAPDPQTSKVEKNLELARQNIDILALLKDKTKGNLKPDEAQMLESLLAETQMRFVEASKH